MASWRELSSKILTDSENKKMRASFDTIGDIAVVEIARGLEKKEKKLGEILLYSQPGIKVVAKKLGSHKGKFRKQPLKIIAGEKRLVTMHKENGCSFNSNVSTCYFSPRMGTERIRIAKLVKKDEKVLVLFAGVAPFPIVIAKHSSPAKVDSVELNKEAHKYALENVILNKTNNVFPKNQDAMKFLKMTKQKYDRILLAWPGHAEKYILLAIKKLNKKGKLHYYDYAKEGNYEEASLKVIAACNQAKRKCKIDKIAVCGQKSPRVHRVCADATIN